MMLVWLLVTFALIVISGIGVMNTLTFPRLRSHKPRQTPRVSLLVPARDEAAVIGQTVGCLLAQDYPDYEVILLDDNSEDGTTPIARDAAGDDPRLTVLSGSPLPAGWLGKNWACHQLSQAATGEWLVFTDADVRWQPDALASLIAQVDQSGVDMLTVWPTQDTHTWAERLVVSLVALVVISYLPELLVRFTPWAVFAAANGQCLAFRRSAYETVGGHGSVRAQIVEDIALARRAKSVGLRLVMVDGSGLIGCRMYTGWASVRDGFAKNIMAGFGGFGPLLLATVFHWLLFLAPWAWLTLGWTVDLGPRWPWWPLGLVALGMGVRALSAAVMHQRVVDALWMPVSVVLMTVIAGRAVWWRLRYGGPQWKGRLIGQLKEGGNP